MRILVIDDNPAMLHLYREILELDGHHVDTAENVSQAFTSLDDALPTLILVDCCMPKVDGARFIDQLKEARPQDCERIHIVGMSNLGPGNLITRECEQRVEAFIEKPRNVDDLLELVKRWA